MARLTGVTHRELRRARVIEAKPFVREKIGGGERVNAVPLLPRALITSALLANFLQVVRCV